MEINKENACPGKQEIGSQTENGSCDIQIQFQVFIMGFVTVCGQVSVAFCFGSSHLHSHGIIPA